MFSLLSCGNFAMLGLSCLNISSCLACSQIIGQCNIFQRLSQSTGWSTSSLTALKGALSFSSSKVINGMWHWRETTDLRAVCFYDLEMPINNFLTFCPVLWAIYRVSNLEMQNVLKIIMKMLRICFWRLFGWYSYRNRSRVSTHFLRENPSHVKMGELSQWKGEDVKAINSGCIGNQYFALRLTWPLQSC
jgi:hypothetical protein